MNKEISKNDGTLLLALARQSIIHEFQNRGNKLKSLKDKASSLILEENRGTFVTLHKNRKLRGCIGNIEPVKNIFQGVQDNAKNAAFNDTRFSPLSLEELDETIIEVSILTQPENIDYTDIQDLITKLKPGIDGVIIKKDYNSATFLPQVWKQLKDPEIFLKHLCIKARLQPDELESGNLNVAAYQIQLFEEA